MFKNSYRFAAVAVFSVLALALSNSANAAYKVLGTSGWAVSWIGTQDPVLDIHVDNVGTATVNIEKSATFTTADINPLGFISPKKIVFQQITRNAKPLVVITDETLENQTGLTWTGFQFAIMDGTTGTTADSRFDPALSKIGAGGFNIDPFTAYAFSDNDKVLDISGGVIPSTPPGNVWMPGHTTPNLYIQAAPTATGAFKSFVLKEQPIVAIPLPAAAWTGLSGLFGLAIFGAARKVRALVA